MKPCYVCDRKTPDIHKGIPRCTLHWPKEEAPPVITPQIEMASLPPLPDHAADAMAYLMEHARKHKMRLYDSFP